MKYINLTIAILLAIVTVIGFLLGLIVLLQFGTGNQHQGQGLAIIAVSIVLFLLTVHQFYKYWTSK